MGEKMKEKWQGLKTWQKWTLGIFILGLIGGFMSLFDPEIPNVVGQDLPAAVKTLNDAGYKSIMMRDENGRILYSSADYVVTAQDPAKGKTAPAPEPAQPERHEEAPAPVHQEQRAPEPQTYYANCAAARAAGAAPIYQGQPGYRSGLDRDGDGIACDK